MDLQEISDRLDIADVLTRYTRAIDSGDWDVLDTVFTADAAIDYTESGGIAGGFDVVKPWLAENLPIFPRRMHLLGQIESVVSGDEAEVSAYFHNPMVLPNPDGSELIVEFGGIYRHTMVRTEQGWRSRRLHEELVWKRGL